MLNVHKDAVIFLKRDVKRTHLHWLVRGVHWVLLRWAMLGFLSFRIFSKPGTNWAVSARPSLCLQPAGARCGGIDPPAGIVLSRL